MCLNKRATVMMLEIFSHDLLVFDPAGAITLRVRRRHRHLGSN